MLVKVKNGHRIYREGYCRDERDGVFRLYEIPPSRDTIAKVPSFNRETSEIDMVDHPQGLSEFDHWLGEALEEPTDFEAQQFLNDPDRNIEFANTVDGGSYTETLSRAANLTRAIGELNHEDDHHWNRDGTPSTAAIEALSGLPNVQPSEIYAVAPHVVREKDTPKNIGRRRLQPGV